MTTPIKLMGLLTLEPADKTDFLVGEEYTIHKDGYRIVPLDVPMEFADSNFNYLGRAKVTKIIVTLDSTDITFQVLKLFSPEEQKVYNANFVK